MCVLCNRFVHVLLYWNDESEIECIRISTMNEQRLE